MTPVEAVERALAQPPAIVFSDVQIIDRTGPDAVEATRRHLGAVPAIFITGTPEAYLSVDAVAILVKPVLKERFIAHFEAVVSPPVF